MEETRILEINKDNRDLNNLIKHVDEVSNLKDKILKRFEKENSIKSSQLKEEIGKSIALTKICDEELILQFMKLFFKFEKDEIPRKNFEENLEGFLSTLLINRLNRDS